jgi:tungstate transport system substrate-binding protein
MKKWKFRSLWIGAALCVILGASVVFGNMPMLRMATTTSTDNTGLLDYLVPEFTKDTGIELQWVSVGTGKALELGRNCDVDVLLVHAPEAELEYVEAGYGVNRRQLMYNDFVIIGPPGDPGKVQGMTVAEALKTLGEKGIPFASRGDNSGTYKKELELWKHANMAPEKESWYIQTGQGMINTINIAAERDAYTMTDRGTFIKYADNHQGNPPLVVLVEGDATLFNQYSALAVNPSRCENVKYDLALKFIDWMASPRAQELVGEFRLLGQPLFTPNAEKK